MTHVSRRDALRLAATTGFVTMAGTSLLAEERKPDVRKKDWWRAWAVTQGDQTQLVVEGIYGEGGLGLVVIVKEAKHEGIDRRILQLDIKTATLPGVWPLVLQPVPAYWTRSPYKGDQFASVRVRYPNGSVVSIDKIIDAGKGPR